MHASTSYAKSVRSSTINYSTAPTCDEYSTACNGSVYSWQRQIGTQAAAVATGRTTNLVYKLCIVSPRSLHPGIGTDSDRPTQLIMSCRETRQVWRTLFPVLWNSLPADLHDITDTNTFKKLLKTVLFDRAYWLVITVVRRSWTNRALYCIVLSFNSVLNWSLVKMLSLQCFKADSCTVTEM